MSTAISLAFGVGMLATITPGGLPFALAALGLRASCDQGGGADLRASLVAATAQGAVAGGSFGATFFAAALIEWLGPDVSDLVPVAAFALALALVVVGLRALAGRPSPARLRGCGPAALFGLAYAIASLPGGLGLLQGMAEQTDKARGAFGVLGVAILFAAGVIAALIAISLLATLLSIAIRRLGAAATTLAGALTAAAGIIAAVYWLPAVPGGVGERGGGLSEPLADSSGTIGQFIANFELAFALLLLAAATATLASALDRGAGTS